MGAADGETCADRLMATYQDLRRLCASVTASSLDRAGLLDPREGYGYSRRVEGLQSHVQTAHRG
jgi:hypothetical protein